MAHFSQTIGDEIKKYEQQQSYILSIQNALQQVHINRMTRLHNLQTRSNSKLTADERKELPKSLKKIILGSLVTFGLVIGISFMLFFEILDSLQLIEEWIAHVSSGYPGKVGKKTQKQLQEDKSSCDDIQISAQTILEIIRNHLPSSSDLQKELGALDQNCKDDVKSAVINVIKNKAPGAVDMLNNTWVMSFLQTKQTKLKHKVYFLRLKHFAGNGVYKEPYYFKESDNCKVVLQWCGFSDTYLCIKQARSISTWKVTLNGAKNGFSVVQFQSAITLKYLRIRMVNGMQIMDADGDHDNDKGTLFMVKPINNNSFKFESCETSNKYIAVNSKGVFIGTGGKYCKFWVWTNGISALKKKLKQQRQKLNHEVRNLKDDENELKQNLDVDIELKQCLSLLNNSRESFIINSNKIDNNIDELVNPSSMFNKKLDKYTQIINEINICSDNYKNKIISMQKYIKNKYIPNEKDYKKWDLNDILSWIKLLENGRFMKYLEVLSNGFIESKITGETLSNLSTAELSVTPFNIIVFKDKCDLIKHFTLLNYNEGKVKQKGENYGFPPVHAVAIQYFEENGMKCTNAAYLVAYAKNKGIDAVNFVEVEKYLQAQNDKH